MKRDLTRSRWRRRRVSICVVIVLLSWLVPNSWVESIFSRGLYPWVQWVLVPLSGRVPFPVMGAVLLAAPLLLGLSAWWRWRAARRADEASRAVLFAGALRGLRLALYVYAAFLLLWGFGYRRIPIDVRWGLGAELPSYEQTRDVQLRLLAVLHRDAPTVATPDAVAALRSILAAQSALVEELDGWLPTAPQHVKHPPAGALIAVGIFGIVSPFTLEANVDPALPPPIRIGICAHEVAHLFGYCGEADANLVGFLAGLRASDPFARYATALCLFRYSLSGRFAKDALWAMRHLPARARSDLDALARVLGRHRIAGLAKLTTAVNNRYLKSQGVKLGVGDYSRGYTLFVQAWQRKLVALPAPFEAEKK